MKEFKFIIDGHKYSTAVNELDGTHAEVTVNGTTFKVELEKDAPKDAVKRTDPMKAVSVAQSAPQTSAAPKAESAPKAAPASGMKVTSPLPGSVIKVLVKEGDAVKRGDTLLTLESMKMENAVMAEQDGVVKQVCVTAGQNVMQEDVLVVLG